MFILLIYTHIVAHHSATVTAKPWNDINNLVMPSSIGILPPQYNAPPLPPMSSSHYCNIEYTHSPVCSTTSTNGSILHIPDTHKSMWAVNRFYASNNGKYSIK